MNAQPDNSADRPFRQSELESYLDETLPPEEMARVEKGLREDQALVERLATIRSRREAGVHSLGEIWRTGRLSCPTREELGSYLLGVLPDEQEDYIQFHIEMCGCRFCRANLTDLDRQQTEANETVQTRRKKYFQSSAGYLRKK